MNPVLSTIACVFGLCLAAPAALTPLFSYRFPASYAGETAPSSVVSDVSAGSQNAQAYPRDGDPSLVLSDDVPPGAPPGAKSLDLSLVDGSIRTDGTKLLDRTVVAAAAGFTMDLWFKGVPGASVTGALKILDDTGTDFIGVSGADTDADGKPGQVNVRVGGGTGNTFYLDTDDGLSLTGWNHITVGYAVTGGATTAPVGDVTIVLNGVVRLYPSRTLTTNSSYTGFNRPVSIGRHPVNSSEYYNGLVYNPGLFLGTEPVAAPAFVLNSGGANGFSATIKDGTASAVILSSISAKLNGAAVAMDISQSGDTTSLFYAPPASLPGGVYTVEVSFSDASGPHLETRNFNVIGNAFSPVLQYTFPASYDGTEALAVVDQSPVGHSGLLNALLALSEDVPPGQPAGARSLSTVESPGYILTNDLKLLDRAKVIAAGGFSMEVWFKGVPTSTSTAFQKIVDYAGTEFIAINGADSDNDGSFGQIVIRLSTPANDVFLDADDGLLIDGWNRITYTFTVSTAPELANLTGTLTLTLNGKVSTFANRVLTNQGDTLNRPIGIGRHPVNNSEFYQGLLYNPSVSMGGASVIPAAPPIVTVSASRNTGSAAFTISEGGGGTLDPASLLVRLDGAAVTPVVSTEAGVTTATVVPATPFTAGRHTAVITFRDAAPASHYFSVPFIIAGNSFTPLLEYHFPDSYNASSNNQPVLDLGIAQNHATAIGTTTDLPVALSDEIPPGALSETKSVSFVDTPGTLATVKTRLLNRPLVITAGGYTFDVWFKGVQGTTIQKVLDYAGTEYIATRATNADGDANEGEVLISVSNSAAFMALDSDDGLNLNGWNHLIFTFRITDESAPAALAGEAVANLNGVITLRTGTLNNLGDTLNRSLNIGSHPTAGTDLYRGLVYHPVVHYGVPPTPGAPSIRLIRIGNNLELTFEGVLQSSSNLLQWTDVPNATSPHLVPLPASGSLFFKPRAASP